MQPIRKLEGLQVLVEIDGEISAVESYLTLSHKFLFKENKLTTKYEWRRMKEGYAGEILTEVWLKRIEHWIKNALHCKTRSDKDWEWWNSDLKVFKITDHLFYCNICLLLYQIVQNPLD